MNKIIILFFFCIVSLSVFAQTCEEADIRCFFDCYVNSANSYDGKFFDYYADNATIIRVVEKDDGETESVRIPFDRYKKEVRKSCKLAKLRKYKNKYSDIRIFKTGEDYKIVAMRMPSTSDYSLPSYFIVGEDNGQLKIKEESMNTKVQRFLKEE